MRTAGHRFRDPGSSTQGGKSMNSHELRRPHKGLAAATLAVATRLPDLQPVQDGHVSRLTRLEFRPPANEVGEKDIWEEGE